MYARVVVDTGATSSIDSLTYEIPDGLAGRLEIGACVLVPLSSRQAVGYVIAIEEESEVEKTRPIIAQVDSPVRLTQDMLAFAKWISARYMSPLARSVAAMLPGVMQCRVQARIVREHPVDPPDLTASERQLVERIDSYDEPPTPEAPAEGGDRSALQRLRRRLEARGVIRRVWSLLPPTGKPRTLRGVRLAEDAVSNDGLSARQSEAVKVLTDLGREASLLELTQKHGLSAAAISALRKKGVFQEVDILFRRAPAFTKMPSEQFELSDEQAGAVEQISGSIDTGEYSAHLLHGVTASGKTEVYLRCIERALSLGKTSLVLLPEIAITTQLMNIFKSRFGDQAAVLHSALSAGERCDEWIRAARGEAKIVVGARSAVFAPLSDLGLLVVDEEHESSYKQDTQPRYNARDAAVERARQAGATLVLGSATPSIESSYLADQGDYNLLTMPHRVERRPMPKIYVADLREEWTHGKPTIFSARLEEAIRERIDRKQQVILLQNRRAYSTFLLCRDCGHVEKCPHCDVALKFHSAAKKVRCHHCGHERPAPTTCPKCQSEKIKMFGIGTERVEQEATRVFPEAAVIRMDRDTTSRKGAHGSILGAFRRGEADILVGTQMIAKGLDFPRVTLVGVISADTSLNLPDFRASERTFQLISQVAGRSGRGTEPGEVIVQTFDPDQYAIQCAVNHDCAGFYEHELAGRREVKYPPFYSLVNVISRDPVEQTAEARLSTLVGAIKSQRMSERRHVELMGPMPAVIPRIRGEYRYHLLLRSPDREVMLAILQTALSGVPNVRRYMAVDVDPLSML